MEYANTKEMMDCASAYYDAAMFCLDRACAFQRDTVPNSPQLLAGIMNLSFCVELCLKSRINPELFKKGRAGRTHKLIELFDLIEPESEKKSIINGVVADQSMKYLIIDACSFREKLTICSNNFEKVRYGHEPDSHFTSLPIVLDSIARVLLGMAGFETLYLWPAF